MDKHPATTSTTAACKTKAKAESSELITRLTGKPVSKKCADLLDKRSQLPVWSYKETLFKLLSEHRALVIVGETGSGKTTQIPQWCVEYCHRRSKNDKQKPSVACTQPRRVAAMSIASRVAEEMDVELGREVGYSVRFEACTSGKTVLKYLTDGMLLREAMIDNMLSQYEIIILDEAHERTLQTEILLGVVKRIADKRNSDQTSLNPLTIIVMSATINVHIFKKYLNAPELKIEGRQHPVQDMFAEVPQSDLLTSTLITVFQIHRNQDTNGDMLVFCSGQDEIHSLIALCKKVLKTAKEHYNLTPLPLYASLPVTHQMRVFERKRPPEQNGPSSSNSSSKFPDQRVIFATNVAETSVTIPNIRYVIDTGKVKCKAYCPRTGLESLKVTTISKAQASQRSGRAGRVFAGTCYRLYTSEEYEVMCDHLPPEIKRCNLDSVVMQLIGMKIKDIGSFQFLERPEDVRIKAAISSLLGLKAIRTVELKHDKTNGHSDKSRVINDNLLNLHYELTPLGTKISRFPLSPSMSRILIAANELGCLEEALTVVSILYTENLFHIPQNKQAEADTILERFKSNEGDTVMLLKVFRAFKKVLLLNKKGLKSWCNEHFINTKNLRLARAVRKQLSEICKDTMHWKASSCQSDTSKLRKAMTYGLINNVATMWNGKYRNKSINDLNIHPSSCLFKARPECLLYVDVLETNKSYMRNCTLIDQSWVAEISSTNTDSNSTPSKRVKYQ